MVEFAFERIASVNSEDIKSKDKINKQPDNCWGIGCNVNVSLLYSNLWQWIAEEHWRSVKIVVSSKESDGWEYDISPKDKMIFKAH